MGKPKGFMEYPRIADSELLPEQRMGSFCEIHQPLCTEERRKQAARCMDCGVPFCQTSTIAGDKTFGCPLANLIPEWNECLYTGDLTTALSRLTKTNNFPEFTGRVCPALCESACICGIYSNPVTSKANELSIIEWAFENQLIQPRIPSHRSGKRIAIVGSGPAGLAAADCLNQRGHSVSIFEKEIHPGGMLMYGIPEMKLPKSVIFRRIELMKSEGVEFKTECEIGRDIEKSTLVADYDAVILCCGVSQPRLLSFECSTECSSGIHYAAEYLKASAEAVLAKSESRISARDKKVVVIGAGDTATDCVAVALRQGCNDITQFVRRPKSDYCNTSEHLFASTATTEYVTDYGQHEALFRFGRDPRIHEHIVQEVFANSEGALTQIRVSSPSLKEDIGNKSTILSTDLMIIASGFSGCDPKILKDFNVEVDKNNAIKSQRFQISDEPIFIAGDMRRGQSLVVWAIAEGRMVARDVDVFLMGYSNMR